MERYSRQILFQGIGAEGQERIRRARVVIVGCGALGSNSAQLLARAGVGTLKICDRDYVESNNLQRQTLFDEKDAAGSVPKAVAAAAKLRTINSEVAVEPVVIDVNAGNVEGLIDRADVVVDGADNFETRFLINDACLKHGIPWIYGACLGSYGVAMPILPATPPAGPCFQCLIPTPPPAGTGRTCDTAGILNTIAALIASIQANEALKIMTGKRESIAAGVLCVDLWQNTWQIFRAKKNPSCPACAARSFDHLRPANASATITLCGRNAVQVVPPAASAIDLGRMAETLARHGKVRRNDHLLRLESAQFELTLFPDGRAIIKGTDDPAVAKNIYAKYVGI